MQENEAPICLYTPEGKSQVARKLWAYCPCNSFFFLIECTIQDGRLCANQLLT